MDELIPFNGHRGGLACAAALERDDRTLVVRFELRGALETVRLATPATRPQRRQGLWQETCFECFLAPADSAGYWEINLSPAGHWNVYCFDDYRTGMRPEERIGKLPLTVHREPRRLTLAGAFDPAALALAGQGLEIGLAAVIERTDGSRGYWALAHAAERPDFHRRSSFTAGLISP